MVVSCCIVVRWVVQLLCRLIVVSSAVLMLVGLRQSLVKWWNMLLVFLLLQFRNVWYRLA